MNKDNINIKEQLESYIVKIKENTYWVWLITSNPNKWYLSTHCHDSFAKMWRKEWIEHQDEDFSNTLVESTFKTPC